MLSIKKKREIQEKTTNLDFWGLYFFEKFYPIHAQIFYPPLAFLDFWGLYFFENFILYMHKYFIPHLAF